LFNNGPCIAAAYLEHIFDSFFSTKDTGIDIGLAICQSNTAMVAASRVQNRPNGGAHFRFTLPAPIVVGLDSRIGEFVRQKHS
jgi:two-component system, LuxR family, sensor kinase FixL